MMFRHLSAFTVCCLLVTQLGCSSSPNSSEAWSLDALKGQTTWKGHSGRVREVALSRDGRRAASCADDKTLRTWDVTRGKELQRVTENVAHLAITPDGKQVVHSGSKRTVKDSTATDTYFLVIRDVETGAEVRKTEETTDMVDSLVVSADGQRALTGGNTHTYLWDLSTGKLLKKFDGLQNHSYAVALSPEGGSALTVSGNDVAVLNLEKEAPLRKVSLHKQMPMALALSPDDKQALSGGFDGMLILWEVATGTEVRSWKAHGACVKGVAFLPDGKRAVSQAEDGSIRVWELDNAGQVAELTDRTGFGMALSADGKWVLHGGNDGSLTLRPVSK